MNATNLTAEAALDSAMDTVCEALNAALVTIAGEYDLDLYACTLSHMADLLKNARIDLRAAGAADDDPLDDMEYEAQFAMYQAQIALDKQQADLPAHQRGGYVERLYELHDMRESA